MNPMSSILAGDRPAAAREGRVFRLTYSNVRPDDDPELFKCRDAIAFNELSAALADRGKSYGTTVFFYPDDDRRLAAFPTFAPSDVLVMTTRPPLDDRDKQGFIPPHRKRIWPTETELEEILADELGSYLQYCTRKRVELAPKGASLLQPEVRALWSRVEFYEYLGARVQRHFAPAPVKSKAGQNSTIVFFLHVKGIPGLKCDFIASFGMDGYGTLIWNRLIRTRYAAWLDAPCFIMAELIYKQAMPPEPRPLTPEFADDPAFAEVRFLTTLGPPATSPAPTKGSNAAGRRAAAGRDAAPAR